MAGFEAGGPFVQWMGDEFGDMQLAMLTPELGRYFGTNEGVLVVRKPDDDAYKLEDGDVIVSIDGRKPSSGSHATRIIRSYQPGDKLAVKVMRLKKPIELRITMPAGSEHPGVRRFSTEEAD
jgi:S1-C subfamily serine protease